MQNTSYYISKNGIGIKLCIEDNFISSIDLKITEDEIIPSGNLELIDKMVSYLDGKVVDLSFYLDKIFWQKCTDFEKNVYKKLSNIKFGKYVSYEELAEMLGSKRYARAVGKALAKNPFPLIIPCHRVLPKSFCKNKTEIGGFKSGIEVKKKLLKIEGIL